MNENVNESATGYDTAMRVAPPRAADAEHKHAATPYDTAMQSPPAPRSDGAATNLAPNAGEDAARLVTPLAISPSESEQKLHDAPPLAHDWAAPLSDAEHKAAMDAYSQPLIVKLGAPNQQDVHASDEGVTMFGLQSHYAGEAVSRGSTQAFAREGDRRTYYTDEKQRVRYATHVDESGHFVDADGRPIDSAGTSAIRVGEGIGGHLFTMDEAGTTYAADAHAELRRLNPGIQVGDTPDVYFHHSSLAAGEAVAGYGEMYVEQGGLVAISDASGHYHDLHNPQEATGMRQTLERDIDLGADLRRTNVHLVQKVLPDGAALPMTDSTVDEFFAAEGDQGLLYTLQLSTQEYYDTLAREDGLDHKHGDDKQHAAGAGAHSAVDAPGNEHIAINLADYKHGSHEQAGDGDQVEEYEFDIEPAAEADEPLPELPNDE